MDIWFGSDAAYILSIEINEGLIKLEDAGTFKFSGDSIFFTKRRIFNKGQSVEYIDSMYLQDTCAVFSEIADSSFQMHFTGLHAFSQNIMGKWIKFESLRKYRNRLWVPAYGPAIRKND